MKDSVAPVGTADLDMAGRERLPCISVGGSLLSQQRYLEKKGGGGDYRALEAE